MTEGSSIVVSLQISAQEFERLYRGRAREVVCLDHLGRRVRFPANILRPYVLRDGVKGCFRIDFDRDNRFRQIEKIG